MHIPKLTTLKKQIRFSFSLISITTLLMISCIAFVAHAQTLEEATDPEASRTGEATATPATTANNVRAVPSEVRSTTAERMLAENRQTRIRNLAANMANRMDAAVRRLENIATRLESRIVKLQQRGADTTTAEATLDTATEAIREAKAQLGTIDEIVYEAITSEQPRTQWQTVREQYIHIKSQLIKAHEALVETTRLLKEASAALTPNASSTVDNIPAASVLEE